MNLNALEGVNIPPFLQYVMDIDEDAAYKSISMGVGQILRRLYEQSFKNEYIFLFICHTGNR